MTRLEAIKSYLENAGEIQDKLKICAQGRVLNKDEMVVMKVALRNLKDLLPHLEIHFPNDEYKSYLKSINDFETKMITIEHDFYRHNKLDISKTDHHNRRDQVFKLRSDQIQRLDNKKDKTEIFRTAYKLHLKQDKQQKKENNKLMDKLANDMSGLALSRPNSLN